MSDSNSNHKIFKPDVESVSEFLERFKLQNHSVLEEKKEDDKSKAMLLANALPVDILTDIQRKLKPTKLSNATYEQIETHLTSLHSTKKSIIGAAVAFLHRRQQAGESIENFAKSLNELASQCSYSECCRDRMQRDVFVSGLNNTKIMSSLIQEAETKKFNELVEKAKLLEQLRIDIADINPTAKQFQQNAVRQENPKRNNNNKPNSTQSGYSFNKNNKKQEQVSPRYICYRCGQAGSHLAQNCFALKLKCSKCSLTGHLNKMCKTRSSNKGETKQNSQFNHIAMKEEEEDPAKYFNTMYSIRRHVASRGTSPSRTSPTRVTSPATNAPPGTAARAPKEVDGTTCIPSKEVHDANVSCFNKFDTLGAFSDTDTLQEGDTPVTPVCSVNGIYNDRFKGNNKSDKKHFLE